MGKTVKSLKSNPKNVKFNDECDPFIHTKKQRFNRTDKFSIISEQ
jgi:hypothetical protein